MKYIALLLLAASTSALADDAGILRCRAIKDSGARLACYDAIAVPSAAAAQPKAGAPAAASSAAPKAAAAPASPATQFGMESKQPVAQLESIESTVPGVFKGWGPGTQITFANGQVWQISDGSSGFVGAENPKVKVRRGFMGAFYLEIEGSNRSPGVKRVK